MCVAACVCLRTSVGEGDARVSTGLTETRSICHDIGRSCGLGQKVYTYLESDRTIKVVTLLF